MQSMPASPTTRRISMLGLGEATPETEPPTSKEEEKEEPASTHTLMQEMEERWERDEKGNMKYIDRVKYKAMKVRTFDKEPELDDMLGQAVFMRVSHNQRKREQQEKQHILQRDTGAAVRIQAAARGRQVRAKVHAYMVQQANEKGEMLAMPGTTLGQSGWYQQGTLVYKFNVTADGEFVQLNDGVEEPHWRRMYLLEQAEEQLQRGQQKYGTVASGTAALQQRRERNEVDRLVAGVQNQAEVLLPLVLRLQSVARGLLGRLKSRRVALAQANGEGAMLAMPGTVQGGTGWYQAGNLVFRYEVLSDGDFQQVGDPMTVREWRLMMIRREWSHNGRPTTAEQKQKMLSMHHQQQAQQPPQEQAVQRQQAQSQMAAGQQPLPAASPSLGDGWGGGEDGAAAALPGTSVTSGGLAGRPGSGGLADGVGVGSERPGTGVTLDTVRTGMTEDSLGTESMVSGVFPKPFTQRKTFVQPSLHPHPRERGLRAPDKDSSVPFEAGGLGSGGGVSGDASAGAGGGAFGGMSTGAGVGDAFPFGSGRGGTKDPGLSRTQVLAFESMAFYVDSHEDLEESEMEVHDRRHRQEQARKAKLARRAKNAADRRRLEAEQEDFKDLKAAISNRRGSITYRGND